MLCTVCLDHFKIKMPVTEEIEEAVTGIEIMATAVVMATAMTMVEAMMDMEMDQVDLGLIGSQEGVEYTVEELKIDNTTMQELQQLDHSLGFSLVLSD